MTKSTVHERVKKIKDAVKFYEDGIITEYEMFIQINDTVSAVDWQALKDKHSKILGK